MTKFEIKIDEKGNSFSLYRDNEFCSSKPWIGDHLVNIATAYTIDIRNCESESHVFSILQQSDEFSIEILE